MAWPNSRILDFIARQTKITAAFLNALQDWVIALSTGTVSLKALTLDLVGGAAAAAADGLHITWNANNSLDAALNAGAAQVVLRGPAGKSVSLGSGLAAGDGWSFYTEALGLHDTDGWSVLTAGLIPIAWGQVRVSAGGAIASNEGEGYVKASTVITGQQLKIILTEATAGVELYAVTATNDATSGLAAGWCQVKQISSTEFRIEWYGSGGSQYDPSSAGARVSFHVFGRGT